MQVLKKLKFSGSIAPLAILLCPPPAGAQEPPLQEIRFQESREDFPNPERGWYRYREMSASGSFDFDLRGGNGTLAFLKIRADAHRAGDLPAALLARLQQAFDQARRDGVKLIPRVAYNNGPEAGCAAEYGCDAPKAIILRHIAQLAPVWKRNKDVIHLIDPGFIGGWGEWHTSSNGLDNKADRTDILFAILDSLPADRMTYIRYPGFKREIFGGTQSSESPILGADRAFDGSRFARVGHLNDCFLSSENDVGTYQVSGWNRARELGYLSQEAPFTPFGGETCAMHARGECASALAEMKTLHVDHLNRDYHGDVIARWRTQGCLDTISLKLGHRLALEWAQLPAAVKPGGLLRVRFAIRNHGFGELFNPRKAEAVLYREGSGARLLAAPFAEDPRRWSGGSTDTVDATFTVPADLAEGAWRLGLRLADADTGLAKDPRYSIRLAHPSGWNAALGINDLKTDLQVAKSAPGQADPGATRFERTGGSVRVRAGTLPRGWSFRSAGSGKMEIGVPEGGAGPVEARLTTLSGLRVETWNLSSPASARGYSLALPDLPKGVYLLAVSRGLSRAACKLIVDGRGLAGRQPGR